MGQWFAKLWVGLIKSMAHTPIKRRAFYARIIAKILWWVVPKRRHVTLTNLRLCFPDWSEERRLQVAKETYFYLARAALDHGVLWAGSKEDVLKMIRFEGLDTVLVPENRPLIIVCPHFAGLDAAAIGLSIFDRACSLYQKQSNPVWDKAAFEGRRRFNDIEMIAKSEDSDLRPVIKAIKSGLPFFYLPDMDHGKANSIFIPFFGVQAATLPMASRLARLTRSNVCMCIAEMTDEGYTVHVSNVWDEFPTRDYVEDTKRVTQCLESWIERLPNQYMWTHRRFKTRPDGEPGVY